jgi:hypothetical protein
MAESGSVPLTHFNLSTTSPLPTPTTLSGVPRIRFPDRFLVATANGESSPSSKGSPVLPTPQMKANPQNTLELANRKRPLSMEVTPVFPDLSSPNRMSSRNPDIRRRSKRVRQGNDLSALKDPLVAEFEPSAFSDEYDLCGFRA